MRSVAFVEKVSGVRTRSASRPDLITRNQSFSWSGGRRRTEFQLVWWSEKDSFQSGGEVSDVDRMERAASNSIFGRD